MTVCQASHIAACEISKSAPAIGQFLSCQLKLSADLLLLFYFLLSAFYRDGVVEQQVQPCMLEHIQVRRTPRQTGPGECTRTLFEKQLLQHKRQQYIYQQQHNRCILYSVAPQQSIALGLILSLPQPEVLPQAPQPTPMLTEAH